MKKSSCTICSKEPLDSNNLKESFYYDEEGKLHAKTMMFRIPNVDDKYLSIFSPFNVEKMFLFNLLEYVRFGILHELDNVIKTENGYSFILSLRDIEEIFGDKASKFRRLLINLSKEGFLEIKHTFSRGRLPNTYVLKDKRCVDLLNEILDKK